jgi:hypothetical protein
MPAHSGNPATLPIKRRLPLLAAGLVWLGLTAAGTLMMLSYAQSPGQPGTPPPNWPAASIVPVDHALPTLVVFIHPRCPCSSASIGELALLMAHSQGRVNAHVLFLQPRGMTQEWTESDTWRAASLIPGVTIHRDNAGREARLFCAETSGDTALYDTQGRLTFHGGITASRGHAGDNAGRDALQALILGTAAPRSSTSTYGCSLFECTAPAK